MVINQKLSSTLMLCMLFLTQVAGADIFGFVGQIDTVTVDNGESVFSGTVMGDDIRGGMNYETAVGTIVKIGSSFPILNVNCCNSAGGVTTTDNVVLNEAAAELYNQLLGTSQFSNGDIVDILHAEGDNVTPTDTRVELGVTFVLFEDSIDDGKPYDFREDDLQFSIAFVLEESMDVEIFSAYSLVFKNSDGDNVPDYLDNCTLVSNSNQRDTDGDGIGNSCDADIDNNCAVNFLDFTFYPPAFLSQEGDPTFNENVDFIEDGVIGFLDLAYFKNLFFRPPGPSIQECMISR